MVPRHESLRVIEDRSSRLHVSLRRVCSSECLPAFALVNAFSPQAAQQAGAYSSLQLDSSRRHCEHPRTRKERMVCEATEAKEAFVRVNAAAVVAHRHEL